MNRSISYSLLTLTILSPVIFFGFYTVDYFIATIYSLTPPIVVFFSFAISEYMRKEMKKTVRSSVKKDELESLEIYSSDEKVSYVKLIGLGFLKVVFLGPFTQLVALICAFILFAYVASFIDS